MPENSILLIGVFPLASGGRKAVCEEMAERLQAAGWRVYCASAKTGRIARLLDMLWTAWTNRRSYSMAHVEVFSGPAFVWAEVVSLLLWLLNKPQFFTLHGGNLPAFSRQRPNRVAALLRRAVAVTAPSRYLYEQMIPYRQDLVLLPNALDLDQHHFRVRSRPAPRLIWVRSFHRIYNPQLAVEALARLTPEFPDIQLTMLGPDKDGSLEMVRETAKYRGILDRITFAGAVSKSQVPGWLDRADIFLNTTNIDNMPLSVLEAMASGLCVVTTDVGGIPYLASHGKDALLVPPDDAEALAGAVQALLRSPDLAGRLSVNARHTACQYDWRLILPKWLDLFGTVEAGKLVTTS